MTLHGEPDARCDAKDLREGEKARENGHAQLRRERSEAYPDTGYGACLLARSEGTRIVFGDEHHIG